MLKKTGIAEYEDIKSVIPNEVALAKGPVAMIECFQEIPCNPCYTYCKSGAISNMDNINERPNLDYAKCNGCAICASACPGLAIFIIDYNFSKDKSLLKIPYEFNPLPQQGETVLAINRAGEEVGIALINKVQIFKKQEKTPILWLEVDKNIVMETRHIKRRRLDE